MLLAGNSDAEIKKMRKMMKKAPFAFSPPVPFKDNLDMCFLVDSDKSFSTKSATASMMMSNSEVRDTKIEVPLKSGIPIKNVNDDGDGNNKCFTLCEQEWNFEQVQRFYKFVKHGYGYRLYLDDLPSATIINDETFYGSTIPVGYSQGDDKKVHIDYDGILQDINIFNHLDITVLVHETGAS